VSKNKVQEPSERGSVGSPRTIKPQGMKERKEGRLDFHIAVINMSVTYHRYAF
jgi:hypothetical protein